MSESKKVCRVSDDGVTVCYASLTHAAEANKCTVGGISKCLSGERVTHIGYYWVHGSLGEKMQKETVLKNNILLNCVKENIRLWINSTGAGWLSRNQTPGSRFVKYGLAVGSSDVIGFKSIEITPDMVGQKIAQFVALEIKSPGGSPTEEQLNFIKVVQEAGGVAGICWSVDDAKDKLGLTE